MRVLQKLRSQQGASILLALAVVLVCTMVASIVLVAAAANAGKGLSSQEQTRAFYAVSSAAQLLADDMERNAPAGQVSTTVKRYLCQDEHPSYVHADAGVVSEQELILTVGDATPLAQIIDEALHAIDPNDETSSFERDFTIEAPDLDAVNVHLSMDYAYNISMQLSAAPAGDSFGYAITMTIPSVQGEPKTETSLSDEKDYHLDGWEWDEGGSEYSWLEENKSPVNPSTGNREPESNEYGHAVEQAYEVEITTTTTQFAWGSASYSKGVV